MFTHPDKYSWGISCEYLPGWPEPTEEEIIRLCLCHTSYLDKFLKLHISQTKKIFQFQKQPSVLESLFNKVAGLKACNFIKRGSDTATQVFFCEYCEIFKNTYSQENLGTSVSGIPAPYC